MRSGHPNFGFYQLKSFDLGRGTHQISHGGPFISTNVAQCVIFIEFYFPISETLSRARE